MMKMKDHNHAVIVAIEGPDSVGKETQSKMLVDALEGHGYRAVREELPYAGDEAAYGLIYKMLKDGTASQFPEAFQALQAANKRIFQERFLKTLAWHHDVVVLDRWILSSVVYGAATGVHKDVTSLMTKDLEIPDITVVLNGEGFFKSKMDAWEKDEALQSRVRNGFAFHTRQWPDIFLPVHPHGAKREVHAAICELVIPKVGRLLNSSNVAQKKAGQPS